MSEPAPLYPLFLKLEGKQALVVGGGPIGAHKAGELLACGARVTAVSPAFHASWDAHAGRALERLVRPFAPGDSAGHALVIAATGEKDVDEAVAADARAHGALVNAVDRIEACDFYAGAQVRRGPLSVVIGTGGASPALARKVRLLLEETLPPALGALASALGEARPRLLARYPVFQERARRLDAFVERALAELPREATKGDVARRIEDELLAGGRG